jgi:hypothetical protein
VVVDAVELDEEDEERTARGEEVRIYPLADGEDEEDEERTARGEEVRIYPLADEEDEVGEDG